MIPFQYRENIQKLQDTDEKEGRLPSVETPFREEEKQGDRQTKIPVMQLCMTPMSSIMELLTIAPSQTLPVALKKYRPR